MFEAVLGTFNLSLNNLFMGLAHQHGGLIQRLQIFHHALSDSFGSTLAALHTAIPMGTLCDLRTGFFGLAALVTYLHSLARHQWMEVQK
ncbi:MAG: hypothetical protein ACKO23_16985 [Gemmataceae bacterium]